jgi:large subunit ribosomal protein L30
MSSRSQGNNCIIAIKIRGTIRANRKVRETLQMLRLKNTNNAVFIDDTPSFLGMLNVVRHYVTWGEPSSEVIQSLIEKRGRLIGNKKFNESYMERIGYSSLTELAEAIYNGQIKYRDLPNICPVFKLSPPSKGFKGKTKKPYRTGGELGPRGEEISELLKRMI